MCMSFLIRLSSQEVLLWVHLALQGSCLDSYE
jgi:hypothetical protein